jgi:hypothetical protein
VRQIDFISEKYPGLFSFERREAFLSRLVKFQLIGSTQELGIPIEVEGSTGESKG